MRKAVSGILGWLIGLGMFALMALALGWCIAWLITHWPGA